MTPNFAFLIVAASLFLALNSFQLTTSDLTDNANIWQGFNHKWNRKILNFLTPHRMGSIGSRFLSEKILANESSTEFEFTFTPGVNGDFSYPSVNFSIIHSDVGDAVTKFSHSSIVFNFTDEAEGTPPVASSKIVRNFSIPTYDFEISETVLNGFLVKLKCEGSNCNSNGVWPSKFFIDASRCEQNEAKLDCKIEFSLGRGWTPARGGGKAFNYNMSYVIQIDLLTAHSNPSHMFTTSDEITVESYLHSNALSMTRALNRSGRGDQATGITAFGFELKQYKNYKELGRYLGAIQFEVGNPGVDRSLYNVNLNIESAKLTTFNSPVVYSLKTKTLYFNDKVVKKNIQRAGKVCKDDKSTLFYCSSKGLTDQQTDTETFKINLDNDPSQKEF